MTKRVVVLGAGFGGLELTTLISDACGDDVEIVLVDRAEGFVFGFSKLDVMFGRLRSDQVLHRYADVAKRGVRFLRSTVRAIDPVAKRVETDSENLDADFLVVALGADLHPEATPGLVEGGHEFYTVAGAFALRDILHEFAGGQVIVGVTSAPFKCPPAPSETALLVDELLNERGLRDSSEVTLVMPFAVPIPPSPQASAALLQAFDQRGISWQPQRLVTELDVDGHRAVLSDGTALPYDLFLGVPVHRAPQVVVDAGLTVDGWIPVDPQTLQTGFPGVYAVGDVTSVGTPKAGVFAEGQASVAAARIIAELRQEPTDREYDGHGICYLEFGEGVVAKVDVTFRAGEQPKGDLEGPSDALTAEKGNFGSTRIKRWFDREWQPVVSP